MKLHSENSCILRKPVLKIELPTPSHKVECMGYFRHNSNSSIDLWCLQKHWNLLSGHFLVYIRVCYKALSPLKKIF